MITLSLADIETAIQAAFDHWLDQKPGFVLHRLERPPHASNRPR